MEWKTRWRSWGKTLSFEHQLIKLTLVFFNICSTVCQTLITRAVIDKTRKNRLHWMFYAITHRQKMSQALATMKHHNWHHMLQIHSHSYKWQIAMFYLMLNGSLWNIYEPSIWSLVNLKFANTFALASQLWRVSWYSTSRYNGRIVCLSTREIVKKKLFITWIISAWSAFCRKAKLKFFPVEWTCD